MAKVRMFLLILLMVMATVSSQAESEQSEVWVLCQPDSFVNVRMFPKKGSPEIGRLELGDKAWTDGKRKNGYLHLVNGQFECDGWISLGFVSETPVQTGKNRAKIASKGRVKARRSVNGTRRKWLKNDCLLWVFGYGEEWAVTSEGFVMTRFIEMEGG